MGYINGMVMVSVSGRIPPGRLAREELTIFTQPVRIYSSGVKGGAAGPMYTFVLRKCNACVFSHTAYFPVTVPPYERYTFDVILTPFFEGDYGAVLSFVKGDPASPAIDISIPGSSRYGFAFILSSFRTACPRDICIAGTAASRPCGPG
ncbi:MAG: hypothetical protein JW881_10630 [Spirochaetales bacterium]|nr:hypothetical protein [Spirochaetales bacterium]